MGNDSNLPPTAAGVKYPAVAGILLAVLAVAGVTVLARFWGANPEYADRLIVVACAAYWAWHARPDLAHLPARPLRFGYVPLAVGCVAFPAGWFLQAQVAPKPVVMWWLGAAWVSAAAGLVLLRGGAAHLKRLAFPLAFVLFALPIPNRILVPLQTLLQTGTTWAAANMLPVVGVPVERTGYVLSLPSGDLGVAEACSGVKSVTALTAVAAGVGYVGGFGLARGVLLVVLTVPVIAGVNAVRVIASGLIQEHIGPEYIQGNWHLGLSLGMVLLGVALVVWLATRMGASWGDDLTPQPPSLRGKGEPDPTLAPPSLLGKGVGGLGSLLLALAVAGTLAAQVVGMGAEREVVAVAPLDTIPMQLGAWKGEDLPVPNYVTEMLTYDTVLHRAYTGPLGYHANVWVIFWSSRSMVKGYHHPDVCWPNKGFRMLRRDVTPAALRGCVVPVTSREFEKNKSDRQLILYWTQEGRRVWTEDDERAVQTGGDSHGWLGDRLFRRAPAAATGRLVVLIGTETWGDGAAIRAQTLDFARLVADAVYDACPWADPRQ